MAGAPEGSRTHDLSGEVVIHVHWHRLICGGKRFEHYAIFAHVYRCRCGHEIYRLFL
jgi:hypothetical protein